MNYNRLMVSARAEQIMSNSTIKINSYMLKRTILGVYGTGKIDKRSELYRYYKKSIDNGGFINTKYYSRDKTTFRMFTKKGELNLLTLSNKDILGAIKSRYDNGVVVEIDYSTFEFTIIKNLLKIDNFPDDVHAFTAKHVGCSRKEAKGINGKLFYGDGFTIADIAIKTESEVFMEFVLDIRDKIDQYVDQIQGDGFALNHYGRKIYPKLAKNIFNNVIQSTGSDILADAIISIDDFITNKNIHILYHRFDSLYFDFDRSDLIKWLEIISGIMESIAPDIPLDTDIKIGSNIENLKGIP